MAETTVTNGRITDVTAQNFCFAGTAGRSSAKFLLRSCWRLTSVTRMASYSGSSPTSLLTQSRDPCTESTQVHGQESFSNFFAKPIHYSLHLLQSPQGCMHIERNSIKDSFQESMFPFTLGMISATIVHYACLTAIRRCDGPLALTGNQSSQPTPLFR